MAKDENDNGSAKAKDGQPDDAQRERDQLAMARARREQEAAASDQAAIDAVNRKRGNPIDGQSGDEDEQSDAELFPAGSIEGDHSVTIKNIVPAGKARKLEAKMRATPIPMRDGLRRYGELLELLVTVEAGKVEEVPDLEEPESGGRRKLLGVKDVQHFRPVHVVNAEGMYSREQVLDILEQHFGASRSSAKVRGVFGLDGQDAAAGNG